ncbi:MAG: hypothetical protein COV74_00180 [Candidatus Omnitrophica bacterium CG11_big_fil_rev_8_21_14_0_20_45_26]|uniref:Uncharacterized protein n=1 Tax=Candidatus Abzuiibacterium crystallinum TaxID=1974748 RepID=A0A2H0LSV6_9BACT|nr:MAG: hypothetical protein COV74_00180 [Candidatus Omnitrophica bacterium CG11_big_fil_rev_8_21_14_0_20_45_26]PIW64790.1 MAG: hypothetical protein COW12_04625 [Candidatus Omnitrophica bacterium CG12_big_fil_rev_8_21_14_0_65_45_16]
MKRNGFETFVSEKKIVAKAYAKLGQVFVMPDPGDLEALELDNCMIRRANGRLCVAPLDGLAGKQVVQHSGGWEPVFGYFDGKLDGFGIIRGTRQEVSFCDLCRDKLNGITGNCFNDRVKPRGCSFEPAAQSAGFHIDLSGWRRLPESDVAADSPFWKPRHAEEICFDVRKIRENRKLKITRRHLWEYQKKKEEKYCSRCVFQDLCCLTTRRVVEHCMVTDDFTMRRALTRIRKRFGSVDQFLALLAYSGGELRYRPKHDKRKTGWRVARPLNREKLLLKKLSRPFRETVVSRSVVESRIQPSQVTITDPDKAAALAWFFIEKHGNGWGGRVHAFHGIIKRPLWILPKEAGIELTHYPFGRYLKRESLEFHSFNDILRYNRY